MLSFVGTMIRSAKRLPRARLVARYSTGMLVVLALAACGGTRATTRSVNLPIERGTIIQSVSSSGKIEPFQESFLNFVTNGTVAKVTAQEGQQVKQGQVLASLDTADLDLQIVQAEANLK